MKKLLFIILLFLTTTANAGTFTFRAGATYLTGLSDINTSTATNGNFLIADGTDFESVAISGAITVDSSGVTYGDMTGLSDINTSTATAGNLLIADGTDWESITVSGDITLAKSGVAQVFQATDTMIINGDTILKEVGDTRAFPTADTDPHLRVYSADDTSATDYIEMYHDQTDANIDNGVGDIVLDSAQDIELDSAWSNVNFLSGGTRTFRVKGDVSTAEVGFSLYDNSGNQIVITNGDNSAKDHDHDTTTDPTLFIHSDTDPDDDNAQWLGFTHNKSYGLFTAGTNTMMFEGHVGLQESGDARPFADADTDPHLRVYSADAGEATDYIEMYHDQTDGNIATGGGDLILTPAGGDVSVVGSLDVDGIVTLADGTILSSNSGVITLGGTGGSNNEDLTYDFETTANRAIISTTTSAQMLLDMITRVKNDTLFTFGTDARARLQWSTQDNDNMQIGTEVGTADKSGYISIMEVADLGNANRSPLATSNDPVLRVYSSDEDNASDYIEMYHDQTDANIDWAAGDLNIGSLATGDVTLFEDTDVGDAVDGKKLFIYRKAAEGNNEIEMFIDQYRGVILNGSSTVSFAIDNALGEIRFNNGAAGDISFFTGAGSGENRYMRIAGYITAAGDEVEAKMRVSDTTDNFELTRENSYIGEFDVQMPFKVSGGTATFVSTVTFQTTNQGSNAGDALCLGADNTVCICGLCN